MTMTYSYFQNPGPILARLQGTIDETYDVVRLINTQRTQLDSILPFESVNVTSGFGPNPVGVVIIVNSEEGNGGVLELELTDGVSFETIQVPMKTGQNTYVIASDDTPTFLRISNSGNRPVSAIVLVGSAEIVAPPDLPTSTSGGGGNGTITNWEGFTTEVNQSFVRMRTNKTIYPEGVPQRPVGDPI